MQRNKDERGPGGDEQAGAGELVEKLGSHDVMERQRARTSLVAMGEPAVAPLIAALSAKVHMVRWEAAKALTHLHAPAAATALVKALDDEDGDVRWAAGEALIGLGDAALRPLFQALVAHADSDELRDAAHHVLRELNRGERIPIVGPVLSSLENYDDDVSVPVSANAALDELKKRGA